MADCGSDTLLTAPDMDRFNPTATPGASCAVILPVSLRMMELRHRVVK